MPTERREEGACRGRGREGCVANRGGLRHPCAHRCFVWSREAAAVASAPIVSCRFAAATMSAAPRRRRHEAGRLLSFLGAAKRSLLASGDRNRDQSLNLGRRPCRYSVMVSSAWSRPGRVWPRRFFLPMVARHLAWAVATLSPLHPGRAPDTPLANRRQQAGRSPILCRSWFPC